jgi:hypothetical protein
VSYCTKEEVRRRAAGGSGSGGSATTTALPDAELDALIEQASLFFDLECGLPPEHFETAGVAATARTFYPDGTGRLRLDPYVAGSLNTTISLPSGYTAPEFVERDGYLVRSSSSVLIDTRHWGDPWPIGVPITVTARWGYEATPADVKLAVIELVLNLWRETDPANVRLKDLEGQPLREKLPPRVARIAKKYRMKARPAFV